MTANTSNKKAGIASAIPAWDYAFFKLDIYLQLVATAGELSKTASV